MSVLICPVCGSPLNKNEHTYSCKSNHSFDIAKEGYVNLLSAHKSGEKVGDNKEMAHSRRNFLSKGYYSVLADSVGNCLQKYCAAENAAVLDICCGEGYYTSCLATRFNRNFYGFDISKNMIRLASKRKCQAEFFVANINSIPVKSESVDFAFHLFAPFHNDEFLRILKKEGILVTVIPGKNHLFGLKQALYEKPYYNDETPPKTQGFSIVEKLHVKSEITLDNYDDIMALFQMTPYFYHTPSKGMAKLEALSTLKTQIEFVLVVYKKENN